MATLPKIVCLKSVYNNKYLRYRFEDVQTHGLLQFAADSVMDPYAQFEVETSKSDNGLVHLKSRYTNKYLIRWSPNHYWISASGNAANEDKASWTCTLFKPIIVENANGVKKIRLQHVQLGHYACLWRIGHPFDSCLFAGSPNPDRDNCDLLAITDWEAMFQIPRRVAFKGDNGLYLGAMNYGGENGLQFAFKDPKDQQVAQLVYTNLDGTVSIMSRYYRKYWRVGDTSERWIVVDAEDPRGTNNAAAMFRLSVVGENKVALLNMSPTWFVKRLTDAGRESSMAAATPAIDTWSRLEVVELEN